MHSVAKVAILLLVIGLTGTCLAQESRPSANLQGEKILHCFRPTARFERAVAIAEADVLTKGRFGRPPAPHDHRALTERFGEASISYLRIYWRGGLSGASHVSDVAVLARSTNGRTEYRTELLADTGIVPVIPRVCKAAMGWVSPNAH